MRPLVRLPRSPREGPGRGDHVQRPCASRDDVTEVSLDLGLTYEGMLAHVSMPKCDSKFSGFSI